MLLLFLLITCITLLAISTGWLAGLITSISLKLKAPIRLALIASGAV